MSDNTKIEWSDATWNPVTGCTEVSPGCDHCYAKTFAERWRGTPGHHFENGFDVTLRPERLDQPSRWRKPRRIFVNSMSDLFHEGVPDEFVVKVFARMWWAPQHTFQVLTKRHGRMRSLVPKIEEALRQLQADLSLVDCPTPLEWPLPNVWLGVSVEDQKWAYIRVPALLDTPAAVRFLSCEPLLGPVELSPKWLAPQAIACWKPGYRPDTKDMAALAEIARAATRHFARLTGDAPQAFIDWCIVGGESGPGARPMHPDWARSLRDQCVAAGVPFHFKQWGNWIPAELGGWYSNTRWVPADGSPAPFPPKQTADSDAFMAASRVKSLRELDGRTWDQFPESSLVVGEHQAADHQRTSGEAR